MTTATQSRANGEAGQVDVVIVGAGFAGLYALHRLRELGLKVQVIEAGAGVGGTWYWNRYPGARCDVPSLEYSYSFSAALQEEWQWTEVMPSQPEVEAYLNHVADRFDLRSHIIFNARVTAARYGAESNQWLVETDTGRNFAAAFCVMATGCLSMPLHPSIEGFDGFQGRTVHTGLWPRDGVELKGRRVGIVGTGSSGVQATPPVAEEASHLYVFQRTPVYTLPANNVPLEPDFQRNVKDNYDELRRVQRSSVLGISGYGFPGVTPGALAAANARGAGARRILDLSEPERRAALDQLGFGAVRVFSDVATDYEANEVACELYREQIRRVIDDPDVAEALAPRGYPIGCKRQVVDTDYYQTFNRDNVTLVDLRREELIEATRGGLRTSARHYDLDVIILATGFDAMTGAVSRIDICGRDDVALKDKWANGPRAYLGLQTSGFPNLFFITGPGSPSVLTNMVVSIEHHVDWIADCLTRLRDGGLDTIEPTAAAESEWVEQVNQAAEGTMYTAPTCHSWYLGSNVSGKRRVFMPYAGGLNRYIEICEDVVSKEYQGFALTASTRSRA